MLGRQSVLLLRAAACCIAALACSASVSVSRAEDPSASAASGFEQTVAPALEAKCVACHRPDNLKSEFDITTREGLLRGGESGPALAPGSPDDSLVYVRSIPHDGLEPEMPEKGEPLTDAEAAALRDWIAAGAPWPEKLVLKEAARADATFWSFQPIRKSDPPVVEDSPAGWEANPIDRLILAKLRERGFAANPPADPQTFVRRATYDLTGLPPTPEEVDAYVRAVARLGDDRACEQLVDRLLASPRYGEQWGRHWLDVIRFGESRGYERNEIITNLWPFRDYIIASFNDDKPFDQLVREHLAGDVIGKDDPDVEIGSAFLVAGPYDDVGNQDAEAAAQIRADQMDEMIRATCEAFLGLTMGCARCHDHKFDPLLRTDYYGLYATFAGTVHGAREVGTPEQRAARVAQLEPLQAERAAIVERRDALEREITERAEQLVETAAREWTRERISRYGTEENFEPVTAKYVRLTVDGSDGGSPTAPFKIDEFEVWTAGADSKNVALASAGGTATGAAREADDFAGAYSAALTIDGLYRDRWHAAGKELVITLAQPERIGRVVFSSDRPRALPEDSSLSVFAGDYGIAVSMDGQTWTAVADSYDRVPATDGLKLARLRERVLTDDDRSQLAEVSAELREIDQKIAAVPSLPVWWVGTHRSADGPFHVFIGGSPQRAGDEVVPVSLDVVSDLPSSYRLDPLPDEGERRVALANWITAADNPLTARVLANRVWQYHFGTGIVNTPSDFGFMGSRPTHLELLDWLAGQLLNNGWRLKPLHRTIMTSRAYRQSGEWRAAPASEDADSRLLWRFPPRRLTAEEIRDTLLSIAGRLDLTMGGPGFRLYQYQQDNVATYVPLDQVGPETYRRAVYHHNARASRVDVLSDFDCPDPAFAAPKRAATITPLQALTMMNHSFAVDMTSALTQRIESAESQPSLQLSLAFRLVFGREPHDEEHASGARLIEEHGLESLCRALLNANELIYLR